MRRDNPSGIPREVIDNRRQQIARLKLSGLSSREIERALGASGLTNPTTGKPYDHATICRDLVVLRAEWREDAAQAISEHQARILAELCEVARRAATGKEVDLQAWLKALAQQAKLLGADAPSTVKIIQEAAKELKGMTDADLLRLLAAGGHPADGAAGGDASGDRDAGPDIHWSEC